MSDSLLPQEGVLAPDDLVVIRRIAHSMNDIAQAIHASNVEKGWHDEPRSFGDFTSLFHSELSEALEWYRKHGYKNVESLAFSESGKPEGIAVEMADTIIRILDFCAYVNAPIGEALFVKYLYNRSRPHRHGGKLL